MAFKQEFLRQEKLEQLAYEFERKSVLKEGYLNEMIAATDWSQCQEARGHLCRHSSKAGEV